MYVLRPNYEEQVIKVVYDVGDSIKALETFNAKLDEGSRVIQRVTAGSQRFNAEGKVLETTLRGITADGSRAAETFKVIDGAIVKVSASINTATSAMERNAAALAKQKRAAEDFARTQEQLKPFDTSVAGITSTLGLTQGSRDEINQFLVALKRLQEQFLRAGLSAEQYQKEVQQVINNRGNFTAYSASIAASLQAVSRAYNALGNDAKKAANDIIRAEQQKEQAIRSLALQQIQAQKYDEQRTRNMERERQARERAERILARQQLEAQRIESERQKVLEAAAISKRRAIEADQFAQRLKGPDAILLNSADPANATRFLQAQQRLVDLIRTGVTTGAELDRIIAAVRTRTVSTLQGIDAQVLGITSQYLQAWDGLAKKNESVTRSMLLSWKSVSRIILAEVVQNAIYSIISGLNTARKAAIEFEIAISRIRTISQDNQFSIDEWANSLRRLSDAYGSPIEDVAAGLYSVISNQIATGQQAINFLETAIRFGATTGSTTLQSVDLLSSAINAFGRSTADAESIAGSFFKAIDLGRLTAADLANTIGRITVQANSLGVTLNETLSLLAVITQIGVSPSEAITQVSGIFQKLIRPTEDLTAFLRTLGYETGQAAIQGLGFVGLLEKIGEAARKSSTQGSEFFNEVRGFRGFLEVASTQGNLEKYIQTLAELEQQAKGIDVEVGIAFESPGKKIQTEFNQIRNIFVNDFGRAINEMVVRFTTVQETVGGVTKEVVVLDRYVKAAVSTLGTLLAIGGTATAFKFLIQTGVYVKTFTTAMLAAKIATDGIIVSLNSASIAARNAATSFALAGGLIATALAGAIAAYFYYESRVERALGRINDVYSEHVDTLTEESNRLANIFNYASNEKTRRVEQQLTESARVVQQYLSSLIRSYENASQEINRIERRINSIIKTSVEDRIGSFQKYVSKFENLIAKVDERVQESEKSYAALLEKRESADFERSLGLIDDDNQKLKAQLARAFELDARAQKELAIGNYERAIELNDQALELGERALNTATKLGREIRGDNGLPTTTEVERTQERLNAIYKTRENITKSIRENTDSELRALKETLAIEQERLIQAKLIADEIVKTDFTDPKKFKSAGEASDALAQKFSEMLKVLAPGEKITPNVNTEPLIKAAERQLEITKQIEALQEALKDPELSSGNIAAIEAEIRALEAEKAATMEAASKGVLNDITKSLQEARDATFKNLEDGVAPELQLRLKPELDQLYATIQAGLDSVPFAIRVFAGDPSSLSETQLNTTANVQKLREDRAQAAKILTESTEPVNKSLVKLGSQFAALGESTELVTDLIKSAIRSNAWQESLNKPSLGLPADIAFFDLRAGVAEIARSGDFQKLKELSNLFNQAAFQVETALKSPDGLASLTPGQLAGIQSTVDAYSALLDSISQSDLKALSESQIDALQKVQNRIRDVNIELKNFKQAQEDAARAQEKLERLDAQIAKFTELANSLDQAAANMSLLSLSGAQFINLAPDFTKAIDSITESIRRQYAAQSVPPDSGYVPGFASGGSVPKRGTDSMLALLTPGEFVVRKSVAQENLPLLRALNSGRKFGPTNNSITNDSSLSINNLTVITTQGTPNQIARATRRAVRRGATRSWA